MLDVEVGVVAQLLLSCWSLPICASIVTKDVSDPLCIDFLSIQFSNPALHYSIKLGPDAEIPCEDIACLTVHSVSIYR
jgi:hypothetical protein